MAIEHKVAGPVTVKFNAIELGYSSDGVQIRIEPRWIDIHSDDFGGAAGAPADSQMAGALAFVTVDFVKYESAEVQKLTSFEKAGTTGVLPQYGTLMRQESEFATLLLDGKNEDWTFATAFVRQALEVNNGTRFSTFLVGFECWVNNSTSRTLFTIA